MERSRLRRVAQPAYLVALAILLSACGGPGLPPQPLPRPGADVHRRTGALGPVVTSQFGGQIFGWDIDQNGNDGLLTETVLGSQVTNAIETFDETTGKITKVVRKTERLNASVEPVVDAIAGSDVGIIDVERDGTNPLERHDYFDLMNPVTGNKITGHSKPRRVSGIVPNFVTNNQTSSSQVMMAVYPDKSGDDEVGLYTYDTARNVWGKRLDFPKRRFLFQTGEPNYAAVDATTNEAVVGYLGRPRYNPRESPTFYVMDAATGEHLRSFYGIGYGFPNGMAIDPTTGIMCTTTFNDMDVEFYKLSTGKGKAVQIPVYFGGGALTMGAAVAADPVHHLFLVAQLNSTFSPSGGSTVIVYDEHGKLVEYINGFEFLNRFSVVVPHLAVHPSKRIGYVNGPNLNQLQEFTY
jgi:hypothetical protein